MPPPPDVLPQEDADEPRPAARDRRSRRQAAPQPPAGVDRTPTQTIPNGLPDQPPQPATSVAAKPKPKPRFPLQPPLPPPRPAGDLTVDAEVASVTPAVAPAPVEPRPSVASAPTPAPSPAPAAPPVAAAPVDKSRNVLLLVRPDMTKAGDLQGRKIVVWRAEDEGDEVRRLLVDGAGLAVDPVRLGFASGLQGLAKGDVDGVLIAVGPKMSSAEVQGLRLDPYRLLEVPLVEHTK